MLMKTIKFVIMSILVGVIFISSCKMENDITATEEFSENIAIQNGTMPMPFASHDNKIYFFHFNEIDSYYQLIEHNIESCKNKIIDTLIAKSKMCIVEDTLYYLANDDWSEHTYIKSYNINDNAQEIVGEIPVSAAFDLNYQYLLPFKNQLYVSFKGLSLLPLENITLDNIGKYSTYIYKDKIYYSDVDNGNIYEQNSQQTKLLCQYKQIADAYGDGGHGIITQIIADSQKVYFVYKIPFGAEGGLGKLFLYDGKNISRVINDDSSQIFFEIYNDKIYYTGTLDNTVRHQSLYSCDLNGNNIKLIQDDVQAFCIDNNKIYYYMQSENKIANNESNFYKCDLDGSNRLRISP